MINTSEDTQDNEEEPRSSTPEAGGAFVGEPSTPTNQTCNASENSGSRVPYSPLSRNENSLKEGFLDPDAKSRYLRFYTETQKWYVGPMPSRELINTFLPQNGTCTECMPPTKGAFKRISDMERDEKKLYAPLIEAFNKLGLCPGFFTANTNDIAQGSGSYIMRPDLCLFGRGVPTKIILTPSGKYIAHFGYIEFFIEVKALSKSDPFLDPSGEFNIENHLFIKEDDSRNKISGSIGQIAAYAAELCARQHRVHCFSISIYGSTARIFRWDRAGVIISDKIDLHKNPETLCLFLWRYSQATDAQRGYDTTVRKVTRAEEKIFREIITEHVKAQLSLEDEDSQLEHLVEEHYEPGAVFKIPVYSQQPEIRQPESESISGATNNSQSEKPWDEEWLKEVVGEPEISCSLAGTQAQIDHTLPSSRLSTCRKYKNVQYFLVSVPISGPATIAGRGTRGYWAVKEPDKSLGESEYSIGFLKDTWRITTSLMEIEGEMMAELIEKGVKFVSDIFCQGDVASVSELGEEGASYHRTLTNVFVERGWNCNPGKNSNVPRITAHTHYRMASIEAGYPLSSFRGTKELIHGGRCALLGSWSAHALVGRNHRDIGLANIILVKKRGLYRVGFLIDWELSKKEEDRRNFRFYVRSGTWAFKSVAILYGDVNHEYSFEDDMESFFYVVVYAGIIYLPHADIGDIVKLIQGFFDEHEVTEANTTGGERKFSNVSSGKYYKQWKFTNEFFREWIDKVLELQRPYDHRQHWTPSALHEAWKSIDAKDLPENDRVDNIAEQKKKKGKRQAGPDKKISEATRPSVRSLPTICDERTTAPQPSQAGSSHRYETRSSSKRRIAISGSDGKSVAGKRQKKPINGDSTRKGKK